MNTVRKEVQGFLEKGAVRKLTMEEAQSDPGFYTKLFCVPKPGKIVVHLLFY